jgi:hypothetical protein
MGVPGLSVGRVVHFTPKPEWCPSLGICPGDPVGGRVSRIEDPGKGVVTLHLDTLYSLSLSPPPDETKKTWCGFIRGDDSSQKLITQGFQTVATGVPFDESGKPGTWRYPPRV